MAALDLRPRKAEGLLRLGRSLDRLPVLDRAWAAGDLDWTKARDMLDILTPDNEAAWVERAQNVTNRQLEHDLKVTLTGEPPPSHVGEPKAPARTRVCFDVTTADAEIVQAVLQWARGQLGTDADLVTNGEILVGLLQRVMHDVPNETAPTGERHRVVVAHCPECEQTTGPTCELTDTTVLVARCDAEILELREGPKRGHLSHTIPPATRRAVLQRDGGACRVPDCRKNHHTLVHDGRLAVDLHRDGFLFTFPRGRSVEVSRRPPPAGGTPAATA